MPSSSMTLLPKVTPVTPWPFASDPFILVFTDLSYNVKKYRKLSLLRKNYLAIDPIASLRALKMISKIERLY